MAVTAAVRPDPIPIPIHCALTQLPCHLTPILPAAATAVSQPHQYARLVMAGDSSSGPRMWPHVKLITHQERYRPTLKFHMQML